MLSDNDMEFEEETTNNTHKQPLKSTKVQNIPKKDKKPLPIVIHEIFTATPDEFSKLRDDLKNTQVKFHTYSLKNEKKKTLVIKGLHEGISPGNIRAELMEIGIEAKQDTPAKCVNYAGDHPANATICKSYHNRLEQIAARSINTNQKIAKSRIEGNREVPRLDNRHFPLLRNHNPEPMANFWSNRTIKQDNLSNKVNQQAQRTTYNNTNDNHANNEISDLIELTNGRVSLMGASMGEYVVDIGIDLTMDFCELVEEPILIGPLFQAIEFDPNRCPPDAGIYGTDNYEPLIEAMPDNFPQNMYRAVIDIHSQEEQIMIFHIFSKVV
ncbi:hypothetical protein KQX54_008131 [Cotesia glomerata]|uniref:Uncharacterized protein n=1 Tax=Cotesia glomerata TaxID=32391 RepID=A0AAV7IGU3_COTGL|nr:hypothetical protein KQX54_008131 [Cotesia glomerata]